MNIIEVVTRARASETEREVTEHYPDATVSFEVRCGRGIITACQGRYVVSKEFVESEESLTDPHLMVEYAQILMSKARLVVVVPRHKAAALRLRMLELNNWWLFYYQIHYYENGGRIRRIDRQTWRALMSLPPDDLDISVA
ncbi:MAG: hypothetical protein SA339_10920 [Methanomassiliicoccus sp.]|nr:hypothetical protein [Methanomassiliicoccus sp.]